MICPQDYQPCTGDHSLACRAMCESTRYTARQVTRAEETTLLLDEVPRLERTYDPTEEALLDKVDEWHQIAAGDMPLHTYLGMTWDEYTAWVQR